MNNILVKKFKKIIEKKNSMDSKLTKNFKIEKSNIHGKGVIATKDIESGDLINIAIYKDKDGTYHSTRFGGYINHSYSPNAITRNEGDLYKTYAEKKINSGDEITVDYTINRDLEQPSPEWK